VRLILFSWSNHKENKLNIFTIDTQKEGATLTYLLITLLLRHTYLFTPWSRVLLEKLTGFAASQEISRILWNPIEISTPPAVPTVRSYCPTNCELYVMF